MVYLFKFTTNYLLRTVKPLSLRRCISALYITGDKATKNYAPLHPYMDFEGTLNNLAPLEESIKARGLKINLNELKVKYAKYQNMHKEMKDVEKKRELLSQKLKELSKTGTATKDQLEEMKKEGVQLRDVLKTLKKQSYSIDEDFVLSFLNLPNSLHADCPKNNVEKLLYRSSTLRCEDDRPTHLSNKDLIRFQTNDRYYLLDELAEFDLYSMQALTNYFVDKGGFLPTANPDFVRLVLLEASATPMDTYHQVIEDNPPSEVNRAYLAGGATFEGYLGAFARLVVYPKSLPIPCVGAGRRYEKVINTPEGQPENLFTATQTNAVQTFVATETAQEANEYMEKILNLATDFYKELNIHFRIVYVDASKLTNAECLRANIEMYSPAEKRYICVGSVSNYSDYVSKRIMFCIREKKDYKFPHLVGGPVLYTTRLIALLIENGLKVEECTLLGDRGDGFGITTEGDGGDSKNTALNEFKDLFK